MKRIRVHDPCFSRQAGPLTDSHRDHRTTRSTYAGFDDVSIEATNVFGRPELEGLVAGLSPEDLDAGGELGQRLERGRREVIATEAARIVHCAQLAQVHGVPATPWAGADHPRFIEGAALPQQVPAPSWDASSVSDSPRAVVAADDNNRLIAVSASAAELFGWEVTELVGRRVVTIVPPRLRESHVAGFTRHLTTGETHVLGTELELPVLRADGTEVLCHFLIERATAEGGRAVYLCFIDPVG